MPQNILLGDESVALGAIDAGITAAYGYPGTPSTEILEYLIDRAKDPGSPRAAWCVNEKTAYEAALGVCFAGRRALVTMKHVGLNVAADPFMNSALVSVHGGLVLAVADDPGMHSSQNEQDSRFYADFAKVPCLEPATQQEAYDMTREAFDLSERFAVPVMLRLVTRLAHSRTTVTADEPRAENPLRRAPERSSWILLPANARRQWDGLLRRQAALQDWSETSWHNHLELVTTRHDVGVITAGIARNYLREELRDDLPSHLHIGAYPLPVGLIRTLARHVNSIVVLEDGQPFIERQIRGILPGPQHLRVRGRMTGEVPAAGELSPDVVRAALGMHRRPSRSLAGVTVPNRPPQLCDGCPHAHAYKALGQAIAGMPGAMVTADIGCYTLGALPPFSIIESCVCMGASIGMARGAADAGVRPVVAVIGDSTFLHSGVAPLMDAVAANADMTVLILDNETVGMTGAQDTAVPSSRLEAIARAAGVAPEHFHVVDAHPRRVDDNAAILRREFEHRGLSVVIARRECKVAAKRRARAGAAAPLPCERAPQREEVAP